jgi:hypothetical protein
VDWYLTRSGAKDIPKNPPCKRRQAAQGSNQDLGEPPIR